VELWQELSWLLDHNAFARTAVVVQEFLARNKTTAVPEALLSPDLFPEDLFLFLELQVV
jgi:hypothetical protein